MMPVIAPVAQLDRASDYGSEGREFKSLRARKKAWGSPQAFFMVNVHKVIFGPFWLLQHLLVCQ